MKNKVLLNIASIILSLTGTVNANQIIYPVTHTDMGYTKNTTVAITSSDPTIATAISANTGIPVIGVHTLSIISLAQAERFVSETYPTSTTSLGIEESLNISNDASRIVVNILASDSLMDIGNKINSTALSANFNVMAAVVSTQSDQYQLIINATLPGIDNAFTISGIGLPGKLLKFSNQLVAQNAKFIFDGIRFSTTSNSNNIIEGLAINFLNLGQVNISVAESMSQ